MSQQASGKPGAVHFLVAYAAHPLLFFYDGRAVKPGYHVTEVKAGRFEALDCGANPERWTEIFVQLWDADEGERTPMAAGKFSAIIRNVSEHVGLDPNTRLTFEVSNGIRPMQLHRAGIPEVVGGEVHVELSPRPANCKPRDRWIEKQKATSCCGPASSPSCCS